jgi:hypothetical protein
MYKNAAPCCGYVIKATEENCIKFGAGNKKELIELANEHTVKPCPPDITFESLLDFLYKMYGTIGLLIPIGEINVGIIAELIYYSRSNGSIHDDLEDGYYFMFGESQLYKKELTETGKALKNMGKLPEFKQWTLRS